MAHKPVFVPSVRTLTGGVAAVAFLAAVAGSAGWAKAQPKETPTAKQPAQPKTGDTKPAADKPKEEAKVSPYVLDFKVKTIDGKEQDLSAYKGKVVVIVNVASKCGFTSQYEGLEKLYKDKKDAGLVILGFPADNFGHQEPGDDKQIKEFCDSKFHVTFPMFDKISVVSEKTGEDAKANKKPVFGGDQHPLYQRLSAQPAPIGGDPKWNFTKFVVDRQGNVVARFDAEKQNAMTANLEDGLLKKVDELLAKK